MGYINLSNNTIPLEDLRPLTRTHILELCLGNGSSPEERGKVLRLLPNVWVLDNEYVSAQERFLSDNLDERKKNDHEIEWNGLEGKPGNKTSQDGLHSSDNPSGKSKGMGQKKYFLNCPLLYRGMEHQGRRTRKFYENVIWKIPCRYNNVSRIQILLYLYTSSIPLPPELPKEVKKYFVGGSKITTRTCKNVKWKYLVP